MIREMAIGNWDEWMDAMRARWDKLTDDDWQEVAENRERLVGALQRQYGYTREQADLDVDDFVARHIAVPETLAPMANPLPDDTMGALPAAGLYELAYVGDEIDGPGGTADGATAVPEDAPADNGVRAQPGDVLGLDTDGETTSLGDTAQDEDRRRVDAVRAAARADRG